MACCSRCGFGSYQPADATAACISCPAGMYLPDEGSISPSDCQTCEIGKYQALEGQRSCLVCAAGTIDTVTGSGSSSGYAFNGAGSTESCSTGSSSMDVNECKEFATAEGLKFNDMNTYESDYPNCFEGPGGVW
jgi:hypothetical protein